MKYSSQMIKWFIQNLQSSLHGGLRWVRVSGVSVCGVGVGGVGVGGVVGVMGCSTSDESIVTDICWNHELLHDHDVHGAEVLGHGGDTVRHVVLAPGLLQEEGGLGLEDGVLQVGLDPLHALNTLVTREPGEGRYSRL